MQYKVCLTGLHVCGDLASTCVRLFLQNQDIVSLCTVGCCYNLLTEAFIEEKDVRSSSDQPTFGFPLSSFLNKKHFSLGRNARMIACQSLDRICQEKRVRCSQRERLFKLFSASKISENYVLSYF